MNFLQQNAGKVASQLDTVLPDEKRKELIKEKLGPMVKKINPQLGDKVTEELMKQDLSKLIPLTEDPKKLEEKVDEEAKKIEENEKK
eukprot:gene8931-9883_t